jgi:thiamine pyrophosphokinase
LHAVIIANGEIRYPTWARSVLETASFVIAADGGWSNCRSLGSTPDLLVGDLDSIPPDQLDAIRTSSIEISRHPRRKDATDLELAIGVAKRRGYDDVTILGGIGGRWDQSLANLHLLAHGDFAGLRLEIIDGPQSVYIIRPANPLTVHGQPGDVVSLIALSGDAEGITTDGLEYPLTDDSLDHASSRGVSNELTGTTARITLRHGLLLCLVFHGGEGALHDGNEGGF